MVTCSEEDPSLGVRSTLGGRGGVPTVVEERALGRPDLPARHAQELRAQVEGWAQSGGALRRLVDRGSWRMASLGALLPRLGSTLLGGLLVWTGLRLAVPLGFRQWGARRRRTRVEARLAPRRSSDRVDRADRVRGGAESVCSAMAARVGDWDAP